MIRNLKSIAISQFGIILLAGSFCTAAEQSLGYEFVGQVLNRYFAHFRL
jgi:hypothetical protein